MGLILLKRVGNEWTDSGIARCLVVPDTLTTQHGVAAGYDSIILANLWRLSRDRQHFLTTATVEQLERFDADDLDYFESLESIAVLGFESSGSLRYVASGDLSPFIPRCEEEAIVLLPKPPPRPMPPWPRMVSELNGVYLTRSDDFVELMTVDPEVLRLVRALPPWAERPKPGRS